MIRGPLRPGNRHVMLLWAASAGNEGASWIMLVTVFVYVLHHFSASSLAMVELAGTLPSLLCMPFAGAMADRHDVRRLAIGSMTVQALSLLGVLMMLRVGLWEVAACYGLQGGAGAVWPPARQRWLYALVREDRSRATANAAIGSVSGVMTIAGAALGGVLSAWSTSAALSAATGLQLAATVPLLVLARPAFRQGARADGALRSLPADLAEGFTALRALPLARSVIWAGISWGLIGGAYNVLLTAHVTNDLHGGGLLLGVFYMVDGAAVILGSVLAVRLSRGSQLAAYALAYVLQGAAWGAMFLGEWPAWGAALLAVMRTASGVIIALDETILLATVPERMRGRITSLHMTTYNAASRVALAVFAGLLAVTGVRTVGVVAGAASVMVGTAWWWLNGRRARPLYMSATSPDDRAQPANVTGHIPPAAPVIPGSGESPTARDASLAAYVIKDDTMGGPTMQARMKNPAIIIPEAMQAIQALAGSFRGKGVPEETLALVHLRASQVNGCSSCVQAGAAGARKAGESEDRLATVAAWREAPYFTDAERAALALTEAVTRLADRPDPVRDGIWDEAARHYDEEGLAALLLAIATTNVFNRLNAPTRQVAGAWG